MRQLASFIKNYAQIKKVTFLPINFILLIGKYKFNKITINNLIMSIANKL